MLRSSGTLAGAADLPPPEHDPDAVRRAVDEVFSRPELRPEPESLLVRARDWVFDRLGDVVDALLGGGAGSVLGWLVVALVVGSTAVIVVHLLRGVRSDPTAAARATREPAGRSAQDWLSNAVALERAGDWRAALRCRYRALIAQLASAGVVDDVPGRTAGEYRAEVRVASPAAASDFAHASDLFEVAWYGHRPAGPSESQQFSALAEAVLGRSGAGARG